MKNATPMFLLCFTLLASLSAAPLSAAPLFATDNPVRSACAADFKSLCPDIQPGGGRLKACIKEHRQQLSAECKSALAERRANNPRHHGGAQTPSNNSGSESSGGE